jgi:heparan-alpha-glucosaminide N-acetyltransferase
MKEDAILYAPSAPAKAGDGLLASGQRVSTIDILRALTMVLMIFVNDLWSLANIPAWLGHVDAGVDGIGLADVVFPAFLFIVGLSIPYALENRRSKGDTDWQLVKHVLRRTIALLIMGVFLVNGETINASATGMPRYVWGPVCCLCFVLIWNSYPKTANAWLINAARMLAGSTLIFLAFLYRGGPDDDIRYFSPQWWGILGLIGWAYVVSALVAIWAKGSFAVLAGAWIFFSLLSMVSHAGLIPEILSFIPPAISGGTIVGLTLGGVATSMIFRYYHHRKDDKGLTLALLIFTGLLIGLSLLTRPYWGLAKLGATPAWLFLCSAFTILAFLAVYWIADVNKKEHWFSMIRPAGTATLLCYLIPYFAYFTTRALGVSIPQFMLSGPSGLLKSFLFALLCVLITGGLIRAGIKMKL